MYAYEILLGIEYLHARQIIHRDMKTLNIFLSEKQQRIKIGDLGVSKIVSSMAAVQGTRVGTPLYLAPELIMHQPYDFKVDIWAVGCALYHLATFEPPFMGENLILLGNNICHRKPKAMASSFSLRFTSFVDKLLSKRAKD
jgi:NIMA (never in mitosis gene a)-related kinase